MIKMTRMMLVMLLLLVGCMLPLQVEAILATRQLTVQPGHGKAPYTLLVSQASFGQVSPMETKKVPNRILTLPPSSNPLLCDNITSTATTEFDATATTPTMMVVPRGECTFERKALHAQQLGADAILIYGTLASRYNVNKTRHANEKYPTYSKEDILWPQVSYDYDCAMGRAEIPTPDLSFFPLPYNSERNDPILSGDTDDNLCHLYSDTNLRQCESKLCLLTGKPIDGEDSKEEACCAWDFHIRMYSDHDLHKELPDETVTIPGAYLTMRQGMQLLEDIQQGSSAGPITAVLTSRYRPKYNPASFLIWMMGVCICALAAYLSAGDYHHKMQSILRRVRRQNEAGASGQPTQRRVIRLVPKDEDDEDEQDPALSHNPPTNGDSLSHAYAHPDDSLELLPIHALGFIVMASSGLMILFVFKIYAVVKIMYAFGCSSAVVQVIFHPLCRKLARKFHQREIIVWQTGTADFGDITNLDIVSCILGYSLGMSWLYVAFFATHPEQLTFFWVGQDIMGACMCIVFLGLIKLNSIRVASILLVVAFLYDIFFVFITPYLFHGKSVMITVATSGGPPKADADWCEKYPSDADCQGGDPLPMLLTMPRIGDYAGGASLLGLGDIVLPGLLLSFAARLDAAKALVGVASGGSNNASFSSSQTCPESVNRWWCSWMSRCCSGGYFPPLVVAYAIGLLMANIAVYVMNMGQPALLYLVPCTLGTMTFMGWRRNELRILWEGPRLIALADIIVYGRTTSSNGPAPTDTGAAVTMTSTGNGRGATSESGNDHTTEEGLTRTAEEDAGGVPLLSTNTTI